MKIRQPIIAMLLSVSIFLAAGCENVNKSAGADGNTDNSALLTQSVSDTDSSLPANASSSADSPFSESADSSAVQSPAQSEVTDGAISDTSPAKTPEPVQAAYGDAKVRIEQPAGSSIVYRTPSGKRYHLISTCGGANSYEVTREQAIAAGLSPCQKCAD